MSNIKEQVKQILVDNGLDFRIHKLPMTAVHEGKVVASDYFGLYNDKTGEIINTCKDSYRISQNDEVVELVLRGMQNFGQLSVQKAGSLDGGKKVFIQLAIEGTAKVGEDVIKRYVTIIDSNDGSTGLSVGIGDLTMSCANQFMKFWKAGQSRFKHSASLEKRILEIPALINLSLSQSMQMIEIYNKFQSTPCSRNLAHKLVNALMGFDKTTSVAELSEKSTRSMNAMDTLYNHIEKEMNQKGNNLWGLHSGVTSWTTHEKSAPKRDNGRFESLAIGNNYKTNQQSLKFVATEAGILIPA